MAEYFPPIGFLFEVSFDDISETSRDNRFQSVSGLSVDIETEQFTEGGENRFKHTLPVRSKFPNLVLKRGMLVDSDVVQWCRDAIESFVFNPSDITVTLLDEAHAPLVTWNIVHAYPVKWSIADLNAEESKVVIETLELNYQYFTVL